MAIIGKAHPAFRRVGVTSSSISDTVTLITSKALVLTSPLRLTIHAAGLLDLFGCPLDGDGDGQPGGDFATTLG